ncbi:hypothetical protein HDU88_008989 [Geranomyces variabilis]|nr:hypothetical protein HDU88_008989 [Geranomyces variabilis]
MSDATIAGFTSNVDTKRERAPVRPRPGSNRGDNGSVARGGDGPVIPLSPRLDPDNVAPPGKRRRRANSAATAEAAEDKAMNGSCRPQASRASRGTMAATADSSSG